MDTTKLDDPQPPEVTADDTTMWAMVQDRYGSEPEDVLRLARIDRPAIADDEVLLRVHAAGSTGAPGTSWPACRIRCGSWGSGSVPRRPRARPGSRRAGRGGRQGRDELTVGDEVFGVAEGSFAEYAGARADKLAHKPSNLSFEHAAAVTISALDRSAGGPRPRAGPPGQQVLIIGASGGVGTFAVQIAKSFGGRSPACAAPTRWTWSARSAPST